MPSVTLWAETVVSPSEVFAPGWVTMRDAVISAVGRGDPPYGEGHIDLGARVIAPGFVDLHVHGAAGAQVNGVDAEQVAAAVRRMAAHHAAHGTTALLATTVADSLDALRETIRGIAACVGQTESPGARVLGAHLEGPWLSPVRAGAQNLRHLRPPSRDELERLLGVSPRVVRMVTLAPEIGGASDVIAALVEAGVVASIGHTDADFSTTTAAIDAGARHVTHLFNAMPALHHRHPGPVGAALTDPRVTVELIADGVHLDPVILGLVMRLAEGRVVAVTDSTMASGLGAGRFTLGAVDVEVSAGRVVLADSRDTLAGSVLTMDRAVAKLVAAGAPLGAAVAAATSTPARVIGEPERGVLRAGSAADIVVLDADLMCAATIIGGQVAFDATGLLGEL